MKEFELIRRLEEIVCDAPNAAGPDCVIGIGDDGAVLEVPAGRQLVVCTDTLVSGVHFPDDTSPRSIGHKSLAVNLSDLAAMGAEPAWFFLALTLPDSNDRWLDAFAKGLAELAQRSGIRLAGGDVTSGPLSICVTATGFVDPGRALTRSGARPGDLVVLSGATGAAAHALQDLAEGRQPADADRRALDFPEPRLELGRRLSGLATSCIDVSDGLLADLDHLLVASGVGAEIRLDRLPCPPSLASEPKADRWPLLLGGGDDYELCFTLPKAEWESLAGQPEKPSPPLTAIGRITAKRGLAIRDRNGNEYLPKRRGYEHFGSGDGVTTR